MDRTEDTKELNASYPVWCCLCKHADKNGKVLTFIQDMAQEIKLSRSGFRKHLTQLERAGCVSLDDIVYQGTPPRPFRGITVRRFPASEDFSEMNQNTLHPEHDASIQAENKIGREPMENAKTSMISSCGTPPPRFESASLTDFSKVLTFVHSTKTKQNVTLNDNTPLSPNPANEVNLLEFFEKFEGVKKTLGEVQFLPQRSKEGAFAEFHIYERVRAARARAWFGSYSSSFSEFVYLIFLFFSEPSVPQKQKNIRNASHFDFSLFFGAFGAGRKDSKPGESYSASTSDNRCPTGEKVLPAELSNRGLSDLLDRGKKALNSPCDPPSIENSIGSLDGGVASREEAFPALETHDPRGERLSESSDQLYKATPLPEEFPVEVVAEVSPSRARPHREVNTFIQDAVLSNDSALVPHEAINYDALEALVPHESPEPDPLPVAVARVGKTRSFSEAFRDFLEQSFARLPKDPDAPAPLPPGWEAYVPIREPAKISLNKSAFVYSNKTDTQSGEQIWDINHTPTVHINRPKNQRNAASRIQAQAAFYYARALHLIPDYPWNQGIPIVSSPKPPKLTNEMSPTIRVQLMMAAYAAAVFCHLGQKFNHAWVFGKGNMSGKGFNKLVEGSEALIAFEIPPVEWALHALYLYIEIKVSGRVQFVTKPPPVDLIFSTSWVANKSFQGRYWRVAPLCPSKVWTPPSARVLYTRWSTFEYAVVGSYAVSPRDVQRLFFEHFAKKEFSSLVSAARYEAQDRIRQYNQQLSAHRWLPEWSL